MLREQVQALLDGPADPRTLEWRNPRSGNGGTVTLMRQVTRDGRPCRQIEYRIRQRAADRYETAILLWCQRSNGQWMIFG